MSRILSCLLGIHLCSGQAAAGMRQSPSRRCKPIWGRGDRSTTTGKRHLPHAPKSLRRHTSPRRAALRFRAQVQTLDIRCGKRKPRREAGVGVMRLRVTKHADQCTSRSPSPRALFNGDVNARATTASAASPLTHFTDTLVQFPLQPFQLLQPLACVSFIGSLRASEPRPPARNQRQHRARLCDAPPRCGSWNVAKTVHGMSLQ